MARGRNQWLTPLTGKSGLKPRLAASGWQNLQETKCQLFWLTVSDQQLWSAASSQRPVVRD